MRWLVNLIMAAIALVVACNPSGVVNSGRLVSIDSREVCIEEPDGNEECFPLNDDSAIPTGLDRGDIVSVRVVEGEVAEVEAEEVGSS